MICRIVEMMIQNNIKFNKDKWKVHATECHNEQCKKNSKCEHFRVVDKKLCHHSVYGWNLFELIVLDGVEGIEKLTHISKCDVVLKIIHPAKDTIWIGRIRKPEENKPILMVFCEGKIKSYLSLDEMNSKLKDDFGYDDARNILAEDFVI